MIIGITFAAEYDRNNNNHNADEVIEDVVLDEEQLITIPLITFVVLEVLTLLFGVCLCASIIGAALQLRIIHIGGYDKTKKYSGFRALSDKHALTATETELSLHCKSSSFSS